MGLICKGKTMESKADTENREKSPPEVNRRPYVRIDRPLHVKRLLNKCINRTMAGEMSTDMLRAISYSCQVVLKVFEQVSIEERLDRIEELLAKR
jgi:hypothetical protein